MSVDVDISFKAFEFQKYIEDKEDLKPLLHFDQENDERKVTTYLRIRWEVRHVTFANSFSEAAVSERIE